MKREDIVQVLKLQYAKALNLIQKGVEQYDDKLWYDGENYPWPAWQNACHALFYTNLYLAPSQEKLVPWPEYREGYANLKRTPEEPYSRGEILHFIEHIRNCIDGYLEGFQPLEPCWPDWYDENQLEFHFNNLRHLQHHTGSLIERHDILKNLDCGWQ